ncbi:YqaE/Pmp3 family membrane protein [Pseudonocardia sp. Cha107L01]|uniref:YqaE/Pmp3 family membrane protein n=1 Tax=Pseudonocardia sp. Cha107L01 TaxID=3457576 RepID=UPI00403EF3D6
MISRKPQGHPARCGYPVGCARVTVVKLVEIIIAFLLPPLAVGLKKGLNRQVLIALLLWLLGHIPGVIYALWVISQPDEQPVIR